MSPAGKEHSIVPRTHPLAPLVGLPGAPALAGRGERPAATRRRLASWAAARAVARRSHQAAGRSGAHLPPDRRSSSHGAMALWGAALPPVDLRLLPWAEAPAARCPHP